MAKKSKVARAKKPFASRARGAGRRARSIMGGGKVRWGEGLLSFVAGLFGGRIVASTPIPAVVAQKYMVEGNPNNVLNTAYGAMPEYAFDPAGWVADESARMIGFLAIAKAGYDVVAKGRLEEVDKDVGIPFAIGAILSPKTSENAATGSGGW